VHAKPQKLHCPLCNATSIEPFFSDRNRDYLRCRTCLLVFVPPAQFVSAAEEKAHYDMHRNSPDDPGYRNFLSRLFSPLHKQLPPGSRGLDFGCGPGPTLSVMLEEAGHLMETYDPFYADDVSVFAEKYDFITATEVFEHLHHPGRELDRLWGCLEPEGILGVMTKLVRSSEDLALWHYIRDLTHVCFFSDRTFAWLAGTLQAEIVFVDKDVIIFRKKKM
jgi:2-polyprenyl-3-methyl-5-hydroxy-6-metoxy-1,4-benzoquinol methylase